MYRKNEIFKHRYEQHFIQNSVTGDLELATREKCLDFTDCKERIPFYAPEGSPIIVRLANNEFGRKIERACYQDVWVFVQRIHRGTEPPTVSFEDCYSAESGSDDSGSFTYDAPDTSVDIEGNSIESAFDEWVHSQLSLEERGLYRAVKVGYDANEYAKLMEAKHPDLKPNSVWRKYARLLEKLTPKVERLRAEWDAQ